MIRVPRHESDELPTMLIFAFFFMPRINYANYTPKHPKAKVTQDTTAYKDGWAAPVKGCF